MAIKRHYNSFGCVVALNGVDMMVSGCMPDGIRDDGIQDGNRGSTGGTTSR